LAGKLSWIGYIPGNPGESDLPSIRKGVLHPGMFFETLHGEDQVKQLNILYAKDYRLMSDLELIIRYWKNLDKHANE
jgi:O-antigen biosynthesis protein